MAIPDYQTLMLPLLKFAGDNQEHTLREAVDYLSDEFEISEEDLKESCQVATNDFLRNKWCRVLYCE